MFFHHRLVNEEGRILSRGGATLCAIESVIPGKADGPHGLTWGVTRCHEKDAYCKRTGRVKSEGRARSKKFSFSTELMITEVARIFANEYAYMVTTGVGGMIIPEYKMMIDNMVKTAKEKHENSSRNVSKRKEEAGEPA